MRLVRFPAMCVAVFLAAFSAAAQNNPGNIAALEVQTPRPGMAQQYEQGRKQKVDWHKQQKDPRPLFVFAIDSGDNSGSYMVGRVGEHWTDFDKPAVPEAAESDEYNKVIAPFVQSDTSRYYEYMPKISNPEGSTTPSKYDEVITFRVKYGKGGEFRSAIARFYDAVQKTKWPVHFEWYAVASGGFEGTFVLVLPHPNWADFEDNPNVKPFREMLKEAFGQDETDSILARLDSAVESEYNEIIEFRSDLSYIPAPAKQ